MRDLKNVRVINGELRTLNAHKSNTYYKKVEGTQNQHTEETIKESDIVEEYTPEVEGLSIMTNGSVNKHLTVEHLNKADSYTRKHSLWCMIVRTKDDLQIIKTYQEITGTPENVKNIFNSFKASKLRDEADKARKEFEEGIEAYNFLKGKSYDIEFKFSIDNAIGYLKAQGSWNGFNLDTALPSLIKMDNTAPRSITDKNNPNEGNKNHTINILRNGAYIVFSWEYIGSMEMLESVKKWFEDSRPIARRMNADSYRIETNEFKTFGEDSPHRSYSAEVVLWWD